MTKKTAFDHLFEAYKTPADTFANDSAWALFLNSKVRAAFELLQAERDSQAAAPQTLELDPLLATAFNSMAAGEVVILPPGLQISHSEELDNYGKKYDCPRNPGEACNDYRVRLVAAVLAHVAPMKPAPILMTEEYREHLLELRTATAEEFKAQYLGTFEPTPATYTAQQVSEQLKTEWVHKSDGLVWAYCPRCTADRATLVISRLTGSGHMFVEKEYQGLEATDRAREYLTRLTTPLQNPWIPHYGGPCPVRHEEVEVELRGDYKPGADPGTRSSKRRGMPEAFNWHWALPGSPTTRIDVLNWRRVSGLKCEGRDQLIRQLVSCCNLTLSELNSATNSDLVALGKRYRLWPGAWLNLAD